MSWEGDSVVRRFYDAIARGDREEALTCLAPDAEWVEPEVAGYPLGGTHAGGEAVVDALLSVELASEPELVASDADRLAATGVLDLAGGAVPFAHVLELSEGLILRGRSYPDTSAVAGAVRAELSAIAAELLDEATTLQQRWDELAGHPGPAPRSETPQSTGSVRLAAVDMAQEGRTRDEVHAYLAEHVEPDAARAFVDEIFGPEEHDNGRGPLTGRFSWHRS